MVLKYAETDGVSINGNVTARIYILASIADEAWVHRISKMTGTGDSWRVRIKTFLNGIFPKQIRNGLP